jgi:hypothetical protein
MRHTNFITALVLGTFLCQQGATEEQVGFGETRVLSEEVTGGALPGGAAAKGKLTRLFKTPQGQLDGRLVVIYADANSSELVWVPKGGEHHPADIFARYSDDEGATWSAPVNISNTANRYSARSDWDGDGEQEIYWGDSQKPNIFNSGSIIVVSWIDAYLPEPDLMWGSNIESSIQGRVSYPDLEVYPNVHEVPYNGVYVAISYDGGSSWEYGDVLPPIQLTYGNRDAKQDVNRGAGKRWLVTWQEDPEGLQQGEADGPGDGASGATASKGTDIWYTWVADITTEPLALRHHRVPLSDHTSYDLMSLHGYPNTTQPGDLSNHSATRANSHIINDGGVFTAIVAYEETKGINDVLEGKTIQYHSFPFDQPPVSGDPWATHGAPGATLTSILTNSRRVRFVRQTPNGVDPALFIFWREGLATEGGPADIFGKLSLSLDEAAVGAAPSFNFSTNTPTATPADLLLGSEVDPLENAMAHRAIMRGPFIALGYSYTWNGPLQRYTDLANLNFWVRRTLDGGATWEAPRNLSQLDDTKINVKEPRLVYTVNSGAQDDAVFLAAWSTETNPYEGLASPVPLDVMYTRSKDFGATYQKVVPVTTAPTADFESQLRISDDGATTYALRMSADASGVDACFSRGHELEVVSSLGTLGCFGDERLFECPCDNPTPPGPAAGCANSTGAGGRLMADQSASVALDDLRFLGSGLPTAQWAMLAMGTQHHDLLGGYPYGAGRWCASGTLLRVGLQQASGAGAVTLTPQVALRFGVLAGETRIFQLAYRDPAGACGANTFNATNSLTVRFTP